jgi:hypothetical protein
VVSGTAQPFKIDKSTKSKIMNSILEPIATASSGYNLSQPRLCLPLAHASDARVRHEHRSTLVNVGKPLDDFDTPVEISAPTPAKQIKAPKEMNEAVGFSLVVLFVLCVGTVWGWILLQMILNTFQSWSRLVQNTL